MGALLSKKWMVIAFALISSATYFWFAYFLDRSDFLQLFAGFSIAFAAYVFFLTSTSKLRLSHFIALGILFRFVFLFSIPALSDDYFRFIWDGQLSLNGINPFDFLPREVKLDFANKASLLNGMNSPDYYTVYPPIAQFIYYISALLSPNSIFGSILVIRVLVLLSEIGILLFIPKLLSKLKLNPRSSLIYALNPLVIVELSGNLHFESFMLLFFLLAIHLLISNKQLLASLPWALAAGVKLLPILWLPALVVNQSRKRALLISTFTILTFIALWVPIFNSSAIDHFFQSVSLYHATFEFNASIYYLIRWIGFESVGYNIIEISGVWLSRLAIVFMLLVFAIKSTHCWRSFFNRLLSAMSIYYFMALIVHPWYICTLVFISVFTRYRFAIAWSFLATLSYFAYSNSAFHENYWLIALEYIFVFAILLWEFKTRNAVEHDPI